MKNFHHKLSKHAEMKRFNPRSLAAEVSRALSLEGKEGISESTMRRFLKGEGTPDFFVAAAIASALGVSLDYLADDSLDAPPKADTLTDDETFILRLIRSTKVDPDLAVAAIIRVSHEMEWEREEEEERKRQDELSRDSETPGSSDRHVPEDFTIHAGPAPADLEYSVIRYQLDEWRRSPNQLKLKPEIYRRFLDELSSLAPDADLARVSDILGRLVSETTSGSKANAAKARGFEARDEAARFVEEIEAKVSQFVRR